MDDITVEEKYVSCVVKVIFTALVASFQPPLFTHIAQTYMYVTVLVMLGAGDIQCVIETKRWLEEGGDVSKMKSMYACVWLSFFSDLNQYICFWESKGQSTLVMTFDPNYMDYTCHNESNYLNHPTIQLFKIINYCVPSIWTPTSNIPTPTSCKAQVGVTEHLLAFDSLCGATGWELPNVF